MEHIETIGQAYDAGWKLRVRCARRREGLKSKQACPTSGMRLDLDDGHGNLLPSVRAPMVMSGTPLVYERPSPRLGEHTEEILAELERSKK